MTKFETIVTGLMKLRVEGWGEIGLAGGRRIDPQALGTFGGNRFPRHCLQNKIQDRIQTNPEKQSTDTVVSRPMLPCRCGASEKFAKGRTRPCQNATAVSMMVIVPDENIHFATDTNKDS